MSINYFKLIPLNIQVSRLSIVAIRAKVKLQEMQTPSMRIVYTIEFSQQKVK